jgi:hypothetical protein
MYCMKTDSPEVREMEFMGVESILPSTVHPPDAWGEQIMKKNSPSKSPVAGRLAIFDSEAPRSYVAPELLESKLIVTKASENPR